MLVYYSLDEAGRLWDDDTWSLTPEGGGRCVSAFAFSNSSSYKSPHCNLSSRAKAGAEQIRPFMSDRRRLSALTDKSQSSLLWFPNDRHVDGQDCLQPFPPPKYFRQLGAPQCWRVMFGFEQLMTGCQTASLHWGPFTKVHSCNALSVILVIHPEKDRGSFFWHIWC